MLTYLHLACQQGFKVNSYLDEAIGVMTTNERGVTWVSSILLRPKIDYGDDKVPATADEKRLHHMAHEQCFIANSINTEVIVCGSRYET